MLCEGPEDDPGFVLGDRVEALSFPSVEGNKPTRCSPNGPASHWQHCFSALSVRIPLKSLLLFLRTVLTFANAGGTVLRQSVKAAFEDFCCLRPTMFKCWLNFQFFPRRNSRNQEESFKHAPRMSDLLTVHLS